mgnify:CR=1 FL=1
MNEGDEITVKNSRRLDEIALIGQVGGALDEIVAVADLILQTELDEDPFEEKIKFYENLKDNNSNNNKEDIDSIREFEKIEDQMGIQEHVIIDLKNYNGLNIDKNTVNSMISKLEKEPSVEEIELIELETEIVNPPNTSTDSIDGNLND